MTQSEEADLSPEWEVLGQRAAEPGAELERWYRMEITGQTEPGPGNREKAGWGRGAGINLGSEELEN